LKITKTETGLTIEVGQDQVEDIIDLIENGPRYIAALKDIKRIGGISEGPAAKFYAMMAGKGLAKK